MSTDESPAAGTPTSATSSASSPAAATGAKGLRRDALGLADAVAIGVASTGPAYSIAATLGLVAAAVAWQAPVVVILAFVPILFAALGYDALNRAEPDAGTTFVWVSRAFGPSWGWISGWAIIVADVLVMASLAQVAAQYTFGLFGSSIGRDPGHPAVLALGIAFVLVLTWLAVRGIGLTARLQAALVVVETVLLVVFSVTALVRVYTGAGAPGSSTVDWSWFDPFAISDPGHLVTGVMLMVFIYWGWDSVLSVNEETRDSARTPGLAALLSTVVLVAVYVLFTVAAQAFAGVGDSGIGLANPENADDVVAALGTAVFGDSVLGGIAVKALVLMVLTSATASTQTTILPTARTAFSMAFHRAAPRPFAATHPRFATPHVATWAMGLVSAGLYLVMDLAGGTGMVLDAVSACGVAIGIYYGMTALAASRLYSGSRLRPEHGRAARVDLRRVVLPLLGGLMLLGAAVWTALASLDPGFGEGSWTLPGTDTEVGGVFLLGVGGMALGVPLLLAARARYPFFRRGEGLDRRLPASPDAVDAAVRD